MPTKSGFLVSGIAWLVALSLVLVAGYMGWQRLPAPVTAPVQPAVAQAVDSQGAEDTGNALVGLPQYVPLDQAPAVLRKVMLHTTIPDRPAVKISQYKVEQGDSLFEIASNFKIKPETLLWANYDKLNDNPDMISIDRK